MSPDPTNPKSTTSSFSPSLSLSPSAYPSAYPYTYTGPSPPAALVAMSVHTN